MPPNRSQLESRTLTPLHLLAWVAALWIVTCILQHFVAWRPFVGDVDFYYYLCYSRDIARDVEGISENRYAYFPGVYAFWSNVMRIVGTSLSVIQTVTLGLLLANGLLVGTIVWRSTNSALLAVFSCLWYTVGATRFQGMTGVVEPLATLPILLAVTIWNGKPLTRANRFHCVIFAMGIGLTVYIKQQGGLLSLGVLWLLWDILKPRTSADSRREQLAHFAILPVAATLLLLTLVAWEGNGLAPISGGLSTVGNYGTRDTPLKNVYAQFVRDPITTMAFMISLMSLLVVVTRTKTSPSLRTAGFLLIASAFSCIQFIPRAYHHYFLLALPGVIVGTVLLIAELKRSMTISQTTATAMYIVLFSLVLLPRPSISQSVHTLRPLGPPQNQIEPLWFQTTDFVDEVESLRDFVNPHDKVQLLPPGQNYIHFRLDTISASPLGYSFRFPINSLDWRTPIIVSSRGWEHAMTEDGAALDAQTIDRILQKEVPDFASVGRLFRIHRKAPD